MLRTHDITNCFDITSQTLANFHAEGADPMVLDFTGSNLDTATPAPTSTQPPVDDSATSPPPPVDFAVYSSPDFQPPPGADIVVIGGDAPPDGVDYFLDQSQIDPASVCACFIVSVEDPDLAFPIVPGNIPTSYNPMLGGEPGFALQCAIPDDTIQLVKFFAGGEEVPTHLDAPFWENGPHSESLVKMDYLSGCGDKTIEVQIFAAGEEQITSATEPGSTVVMQLSGDCVEVDTTPKSLVFPTDAPTSPPTHSPTSSPVPGTASPTAPLTCDDGFEAFQGKCLKEIPKMTYCKRGGWFMWYRPAVPKGWKIEAKRVGRNQRRFITIKNSAATKVYIGGNRRKIQRGSVERWFHSFRYGAYNLRYVDEHGREGPWRRCTYNTPIAVDLNKSGSIERVTGSFVIDITGDGKNETLYEWFAPTEGILIDTSVPVFDGQITGIHMFGDGGDFSDGFAKLHEYDTNHNGHIEGAELDSIAIWTDSNSNAKLDEGELSTVGSHGIVSLSTIFNDDYDSYATLEDGSTMFMEDVWFAKMGR